MPRCIFPNCGIMIEKCDICGNSDHDYCKKHSTFLKKFDKEYVCDKCLCVECHGDIISHCDSCKKKTTMCQKCSKIHLELFAICGTDKMICDACRPKYKCNSCNSVFVQPQKCSCCDKTHCSTCYNTKNWTKIIVQPICEKNHGCVRQVMLYPHTEIICMTCYNNGVHEQKFKCFHCGGAVSISVKN